MCILFNFKLSTMSKQHKDEALCFHPKKYVCTCIFAIRLNLYYIQGLKQFNT